MVPASSQLTVLLGLKAVTHAGREREERQRQSQSLTATEDKISLSRLLESTADARPARTSAVREPAQPTAVSHSLYAHAGRGAATKRQVKVDLARHPGRQPARPKNPASRIRCLCVAVMTLACGWKEGESSRVLEPSAASALPLARPAEALQLGPPAAARPCLVTQPAWPLALFSSVTSDRCWLVL